MKIQSLTIAYFGQFEQLTLTFDHGWTNIVGPNESGKSTVLSFIEAMLFGFKVLDKQMTIDERCEGQLAICLNRTDYVIKRAIAHKKGKAEVYCQDELIGSDRWLNEQLNLTYAQWKAIVALSPMRLWEQSQLSADDLQKLAFSFLQTGNDRLFTLEKQYQKELKPFYKKRGQGRIQIALKEYQQMDQRIQKQLQEEEQNEEWQQQSEQLQLQPLLQRQQQLEEQRQQYPRYEKFQAMQRPQLGELQSKLQQLQHLEQQLVGDKTSEDEAFTYYSKHRQALKQAQRRLQSENSQKLQQWQLEWQKSNKKATLLSALFIAIGLLFLLCGQWLLGFVFLLLSAGSYVVLKKQQQQQINDIQTKIKKRVHQSVFSLAELEQLIQKSESQEKEDLQLFTPVIHLTADRVLPAIQSYMDEMEDMWLKNIEGVAGVEKQQKSLIEADIDAVKMWITQHYPQINVDSYRTALQSFQQLKQCEQNDWVNEEKWVQSIYGSTQVALADIEKELAQVNQQITAVKQLIAQQQRNILPLNQLIQQRSELKEALLSELIAYQKIQLKRNWLRDLQENNQQQQLPRLLQRASQYFAYLTDHKYWQIVFEGNQLIVENSEKWTLQQLSTGAKQQLLIAIRLAFMVENKLKLPLFIDEGWLFFDERRQLNLWRLLESLQSELQIISFSTTPLPTAVKHVQIRLEDIK